MTYVFNKVFAPATLGTVAELNFSDDSIPRTFLVRGRIDGLQLFKDNIQLCVEDYITGVQTYRLVTDSKGNIPEPFSLVMYNPKSVKIQALTASLDTYTGSIQVL